MRYSGYERRPNWGNYFSNNIVNKLILANVLVFLLEFIFAPHFIRIFALTPRDVVQKFYFWQPLTYMFLHGGFFHLFFNMLMTWFLGHTLESVWGSQRFLKYYILCGLGGALFSVVFNFNSAVIGASGAVFGLYLAYGVLFPNNYVYIYFLFPIKAKYFVTFIALFQLAHGISGPSGIAYFAHLGGMAAGLVFFRREIMSTRFWVRTRRKWGDYHKNRREEWEQQESTKIDSILDKIASKGYENLSSTEKRILENYSRKHKEDSE
ncbi:MAG: rhomboid family intramembrane serine protease [Candidatus Krumholzibacteria bacterium]|nr:rhomboid family intramembrane serine protease [Candidatus Krumholzibacteria bacterium]